MAFDIHARLKVAGPDLRPAIASMQSQLARARLDIAPKVANTSMAGLQRQIAAVRQGLQGLAATARQASQGIAGVRVDPKLQRDLAALDRGLSKVAGSTRAAATGFDGAADRATTFGRAIGRVARDFGNFIIVVKAMDLVQRAFGDGVREAVQFQHEMTRLAQVGGSSAAQIKGIASEITRLSTSLGSSSADLSKMATGLKQAGLSAEDTRVALEALAKTTLSPTFDKLDNTFEASVAAMQQFGIRAKGLEGALGSLSTVAGAFAVESDDLATAIRKAGGAFRAAAGDFTAPDDAFKQLLATFTSVRQTTRESADEIATGMRTILGRLQSRQVSNALKDMGVNLRYTADEAALLGKNVEGQFVGAYEAISRLSRATRGLATTDPRFAEIATQVGGYRQISRVIPLLQQFNVAQRAYAIAQTGSNALTVDASKAQDSFLVRLRKVREEFLALVREIGHDNSLKSLGDVLLKGADAAIQLTRALRPLLTGLVAIGASKLAYGLVSGGAKRIASGFGREYASTPRSLRGGMATGGIVPGTGRGDTVPASLEAGSFVIRKDATRALGFQSGGMVPVMLEPGELVIPPRRAREIGYGTLREANRADKVFGGRYMQRQIELAAKIRAKGGMRAMYPERYGSGTGAAGHYAAGGRVGELQAHAGRIGHEGLREAYGRMLESAHAGEVARAIPRGAKFVASGTEAVVFRHGPHAYRVQVGDGGWGYGGGRPGGRYALQAKGSRTFGGYYTVEKLPFSPSLEDTIADPKRRERAALAFADRIERDGFSADDVSPANLTRYKGRIVALDPHAYSPLAGYEGGGEVTRPRIARYASELGMKATTLATLMGRPARSFNAYPTPEEAAQLDEMLRKKGKDPTSLFSLATGGAGAQVKRQDIAAVSKGLESGNFDLASYAGSVFSELESPEAIEVERRNLLGYRRLDPKRGGYTKVPGVIHGLTQDRQLLARMKRQIHRAAQKRYGEIESALPEERSAGLGVVANANRRSGGRFSTYAEPASFDEVSIPDDLQLRQHKSSLFNLDIGADNDQEFYAGNLQTPVKGGFGLGRFRRGSAASIPTSAGGGAGNIPPRPPLTAGAAPDPGGQGRREEVQLLKQITDQTKKTATYTQQMLKFGDIPHYGPIPLGNDHFRLEQEAATSQRNRRKSRIGYAGTIGYSRYPDQSPYGLNGPSIPLADDFSRPEIPYDIPSTIHVPGLSSKRWSRAVTPQGLGYTPVVPLPGGGGYTVLPTSAMAQRPDRPLGGHVVTPSATSNLFGPAYDIYATAHPDLVDRRRGQGQAYDLTEADARVELTPVATNGPVRRNYRYQPFPARTPYQAPADARTPTVVPVPQAFPGEILAGGDSDLSDLAYGPSVDRGRLSSRGRVGLFGRIRRSIRERLQDLPNTRKGYNAFGQFLLGAGVISLPRRTPSSFVDAYRRRVGESAARAGEIDPSINPLNEQQVNARLLDAYKRRVAAARPGADQATVDHTARRLLRRAAKQDATHGGGTFGRLGALGNLAPRDALEQYHVDQLSKTQSFVQSDATKRLIASELAQRDIDRGANVTWEGGKIVGVEGAGITPGPQAPSRWRRFLGSRAGRPLARLGGGARRFGRWGFNAVGRASGAATTAGLFAPYLLEQAYGTVENPHGSVESAVQAQAVGGGLATAAAGGQIGSVFGPIGTAVGTVAGAILGYTSSLRDANNRLKEIDFEKSFARFNSALDDVVSGRLAPTGGALGRIFGGIDTANAEASRRVGLNNYGNFLDRNLGSWNPSIFSAGAEEQEKARAEALQKQRSELLQAQLPGLQQVGDLIARQVRLRPEDLKVPTGTSQGQLDARRQARLAEFDRLGGGRIASTIAQVSNVPLDEVKEKFDRMIVASERERLQQESIVKSSEEAAAGLRKFAQLAEATDAAQAALHGLRTRADNLAAAFDGQQGRATVGGFAEGLGRVGTLDNGTFGNGLTFLRSSLLTRGEGYASTLAGIDQLHRALPGLLAGASGNPDEEGLRGDLHGVLDDDRIPKALRGRLGTALDAMDPKELTRRSQTDLEGLSRDLIEKAFGPIEKAAQEAAQRLEGEFNAFGEGMAKAGRMAAQIAEIDDRRSVARLSQVRAGAALSAFETGRNADDFVSLDQLRDRFNRRQRRLADLGDASFDPGSIAARIRDVEASKRDQEGIIQAAGTSNESRADAIREFHALDEEAAKLRQSLEHLADTSQEVSAIQEKLAAVERERQSELGLTERLVTAGPGELRQIQRGAMAAQFATMQGNLLGLRPQDRERALQHLRMVGDARLGDGLTGNAHAERLLEATNAALGGNNPALRGRQADLLRQQVGVEDRGKAALDKLAEVQRSTQQEFLGNLDKQFRTFLDGLKSALDEKEKGEAADARNRATAAVNKARGQLTTADRLNDAYGLGGTDNGLDRARRLASSPELGTYRKSLEDLARLDRARKADPAADLERRIRGAAIDGDTATADLFGHSFAIRKGQSVEQAAEAHRSQLEAAAPDLARHLGVDEATIHGTLIPKYIGRLRARGANGGFSVSGELGSAARETLAEQQRVLIDRRNDARNRVSADVYGQESPNAAIEARIQRAAQNFDKLSKDLESLSTIVSRAEAAANLRKADKDRLAAPHAAGGVIWAPSGTDTVPAILTPGERVINRASAAANADLLSRVNAARGPVGDSATAPLPPARGGVDVGSARRSVLQLGNSLTAAAHTAQLLGGSAKALADAARPFSDAALKLARAFEGIPSSIKLETKAQVEVILNGAQVIQAFKKDAATEILAQVMPKLQAEVKRILSELPAR